MRYLCAGWFADRTKTVRVHDDVKVLREDEQPGMDSHGICYECRAAFLATLPKKEAVT